MLSREKALAAIVGCVCGLDTHIIGEQFGIFGFPATKESVLSVLALVQELITGYDYLESPRFRGGIEGKPAAFSAMKGKIENEPLKRAAHRQHYYNCLANILESDEVYELTPENKHRLLDEIRTTVAAWKVES